MGVQVPLRTPNTNLTPSTETRRRALAAAGCDVAVHYRGNTEAAEQTADAIRARGRQACTVQADLSDVDAAAGLLDEVERQLGPVDVLVPNAGVSGRVQSLEEVDLAMCSGPWPSTSRHHSS